MKEHVSPGEDLVVLPPRQNAVHFILGTRPKSFRRGYTWKPAPKLIMESFETGGATYALVITELPHGEETVWNTFKCAEVAQALPALGFQQVTRGAGMTLWKRKP